MTLTAEAGALKRADTTLTTIELSQRWGGTPTPETLRNWRLYGRGPRAHGEHKGMRTYRLADVEAYELEHSSIPRHKRWKGEFLTSAQLIERLAGHQFVRVGRASESGAPAPVRDVTEATLREWRSARGRGRGPAFVLVHPRHAIYPIEAVRLWEDQRVSELRARERDRAFEAVAPMGPTFGEVLVAGPPTDE